MAIASPFTLPATSYGDITAGLRFAARYRAADGFGCGSCPGLVVVTGASSGVGRATALAFARRGARLRLIAREADGLAGARRKVERLGGEALELPTNVAGAEAVEAAAAAGRAHAPAAPPDGCAADYQPALGAGRRRSTGHLVDPLPGDRGDFGAEARSSSAQLWLTTHRRLVAGLLGAPLAAGAATLANRAGRQSDRAGLVAPVEVPRAGPESVVGLGHRPLEREVVAVRGHQHRGGALGRQFAAI